MNVLGHEPNAEGRPGVNPLGTATVGTNRGARLYCRVCHNPIADRAELLPANNASQVFANPEGRVFEILLLQKAGGLTLIGPATHEATWFPGFAWRIALCAQCTQHLGWSYEAVRSGPEPALFFGLLRAELVELP